MVQVVAWRLQRGTCDPNPLRAMKAELRGEIQALRVDVRALQVDMAEVKKGLSQVQVDIARMLTLLEEQNARNKVVLDGLAASMARHDRSEARLDALEKRAG